MGPCLQSYTAAPCLILRASVVKYFKLPERRLYLPKTHDFYNDSAKFFNILLRVGCLNFLNAFASICLIRSRVT